MKCMPKRVRQKCILTKANPHDDLSGKPFLVTSPGDHLVNPLCGPLGDPLVNPLVISLMTPLGDPLSEKIFTCLLWKKDYFFFETSLQTDKIYVTLSPFSETFKKLLE